MKGGRRAISWVATWLALAAGGRTLAAADGPAPVPPRTPIAVVVSSEWKELESISLDRLRLIFLGKVTEIGGKRVHPAGPAPGHPVYEAFRRQVLRRSRRALEDYWLEQVLSGGEEPPRPFEDAEGLLRFVSSQPGAIAYVDATRLEGYRGRLRVLGLTRGGRTFRPNDPGYPLFVERR